MSPEAVDQRLRDWSQLFELCTSLKSVKRLGKTKDIRTAEAQQQAHRPPPSSSGS